MGDETLLENGRPSKVVAFEIVDKSEEKSAAMPSGSGTIKGVGSYFDSIDPGKTPTEFGLFELGAMARAKAIEMGPDLNLGSGSAFVRVPTAGSSSLATAVEVAPGRYYPSQLARSLLNNFFEFSLPTSLDPGHRKTSFWADQMIQFTRPACLGVPLVSFRTLEDILLKAISVGGKGGNVEKLSGRSSFFGRAGTLVSESVASGSVLWSTTIGESMVSRQVADVGSH